jgi:hypothetical protein
MKQTAEGFFAGLWNSLTRTSRFMDGVPTLESLRKEIDTRADDVWMAYALSESPEVLERLRQCHEADLEALRLHLGPGNVPYEMKAWITSNRGSLALNVDVSKGYGRIETGVILLRWFLYERN